MSLDSELFLSFPLGSWIRDTEQTHHALFPWSNHVYIYNVIIGHIIHVFTILSCSHVTFCINHYIVILVRFACFFVLPTIYLLLSLVVMFTHAYSRHIVAHALHYFSSPSNSQWSMKVCTSFLVSCVGYHGNNYKRTMIGFIYISFSRRWSRVEWTWCPIHC